MAWKHVKAALEEKMIQPCTVSLATLVDGKKERSLRLTIDGGTEPVAIPLDRYLDHRGVAIAVLSILQCRQVHYSKRGTVVKVFTLVEQARN